MLLIKHGQEAQLTFRYSLPYVLIINLVFFGAIGGVLGLDKFKEELKIEGSLKINKERIIVLGIPSLIVTIPYTWMNVSYFSAYLSSTMMIGSIVFGYSIITSLYKEKLD